MFRILPYSPLNAKHSLVSYSDTCVGVSGWDLIKDIGVRQESCSRQLLRPAVDTQPEHCKGKREGSSRTVGAEQRVGQASGLGEGFI